MRKNKTIYIAPLGLIGITILSGAFLLSSDSFATDNTDVVDEINITVPISCSLEGTGMNSHNANIVNGTYQADIGSTTLKAFCNDTNGFAIYAAGYTGDEIGGTNSTKLVNSASAVDNTISTGTATSGNTSNWAMKLATNSGATYAITLDNGFGAYSEVPASYTKVAHRDSGTDIGTGATGASLTTTYAVYINQTQPAGTYSGKVIYTLVHPSSVEPGQQEVECEAEKICYNPNAVNVVGEMGKQTTSKLSSETIWASNFSRTGYGFAGWNTAYDYSGTTYGPNETITLPVDINTNGLSLYAVWVKSTGSLQNWNGCGSLTQGATTALTDERDGNTYAVAKLADGKCWMIENLRLDNTALNNTDGSLAQGYNSSFIGLANSESSNFYTTNANSLYSIDGSTTVTISGSNQSYRFPRYNNSNTNSRQSSSSYSSGGNTYSMGNYYTWAATVADTTNNSTYNQSITATSICPTGWRLPRGNSSSNSTSNDYWILGSSVMGFTPSNGIYYEVYETNIAGNNATEALRKYPNNFLYSGYFGDSSASSRNSAGYYWTSSVRNGSESFFFYLHSSDVCPGTSYVTKDYGGPIRCVLGS